MPNEKLIIKEWHDYVSDIDNLNVEDRARQQTERILKDLDIKDSFYKKSEEKIIYNMNIVEDYLKKIIINDDGNIRNYKEFQAFIWDSTTAWIMAVQIALETLNYNVGSINWVLTWDTIKAIKRFQKDYWLYSDWNAGPTTINTILNKLPSLSDDVPETQNIEAITTIWGVDWEHDQVEWQNIYEKLDENGYILSKEDFHKYFEWDDFEQQNIWDCWLLAAIDSLINFPDYEDIIRKNVKREDNGFSFILPFWAPLWQTSKIYVDFNELVTQQLTKEWDELLLVGGDNVKDWIKALVKAYSKFVTLGNNTDYMNLSWWFPYYSFNNLVYWMNIYVWERSIELWKEYDGKWILDSAFCNQLKDVLRNFDNKNDMLVLWVSMLDGASTLFDLFIDIDPAYVGEEKNGYMDHYSWEHRHALSVEQVKEKDWSIIVTISNPWKAWKKYTYDVTLDALLTSCRMFTLCTKNKKSWLHKHNPNDYDRDRENCASYGINKIDDVTTVNQVVQTTWKEDEVLRAVRKNIIVNKNKNGVLDVQSYDLNMRVKEENWLIIINHWTKHLKINKSDLSKTYRYNWKYEKSENYPLYLYGVKIANFVNRMRKLYIDTEKRDKSNNKPFSISKDWYLQFDDNRKAHDGLRTRIWRMIESIWDDYIICLKDWSSLWVSSWDYSTKKKIADFLNEFVYHKLHWTI